MSEPVLSEAGEIELGRRFAGRVAVVTGAGHGIGRAVAERLAAEGARLVLADLDEAAATATAASLTSGESVAIHCDVHLTASVNASIDLAVRQFGQLDVLVNVAGGSIVMPAFEDMTDEAWNEMLDLNLTGAMRCIRAALPHLRQQPSAAVVSISSVNGLAAFGEEAYSSAKAGL
ncbi:MAG TPA: SDR family NAD(P)-dependent oxidoreductase, partial [Microlunatus sp.]